MFWQITSSTQTTAHSPPPASHSYKVSRHHPCPICAQGDKRCKVFDDGGVLCWHYKEAKDKLNDFSWRFIKSSEANGGTWGYWRPVDQCPRCHNYDHRCFQSSRDSSVYCCVHAVNQKQHVDSLWQWIGTRKGSTSGSWWRRRITPSKPAEHSDKTIIPPPKPTEPLTPSTSKATPSPTSKQTQAALLSLYDQPAILTSSTCIEWEASGISSDLYLANVREHLHGGWFVAGVDPHTGQRRSFYQHKVLWRGFSPQEIKLRHLPKYLCAKGSTPEPVFLEVSESVRRRIEQRYRSTVDPQLHLSFWQWVFHHPDLPILITEGAKKAGALLESGFIAVSIPGVSTCRKHGILHPWLVELSTHSRDIRLLFDNDVLTKWEVRNALSVLGGLLQKSGAVLRICELPEGLYKGADDYLVGCGLVALEQVIHQARPYKDWMLDPDPIPEGVAVTTIHEADIKDSLPAFADLPPVLLVKSFVGSGKTQAMIQTVYASSRVLVITHRQSLAKQLAGRLEITSYQDGAMSSPKLVCCADSLWKVLGSDEPYDLVVIDECEQVLRHLCSSTIAPRIDGVLQVFLKVLDQAKHIIALDADLGGLTYAKLVRPGQTQLFINTYQPKGRTFLKHPNREHLHARLFECLSAGEKVIYASNSKAEILRIEKQLQDHFPQLKLRVFHRDNATEPDNAAFLDNIDERVKEIEVLLYSPTIGTGVSIQSRHFDRIFLCGFAQTTLATDLFQQQGRCRHPITGCIEYWIDYLYSSKSPTKQFVGNAYDLAEKFTYTDPFTNQRRTWFSELWNQVRETEARGFAGLAPLFELRCEVDGHTIIDAPSLSTSAVASAKDRSILSSTQISQRFLVGVLESEAISPKLFKKLSDQLEATGYLPLEKHWQLENYRLRDFYGVPLVTPELVISDKRGQRRRMIRNYETFTASDQTLIDKDGFWYEGYKEHRPYNRLSKQLITDLLHAAGLTDKHGIFCRGKQVCADELPAFVAYARAHQGEIYSVLGLTVPSNLESQPARFLGTVLRRMGLKQKSQQRRIAFTVLSQGSESGSKDLQNPHSDSHVGTSQIDGDNRRRFYWVDQESLNAMEQVRIHREEIQLNEIAVGKQLSAIAVLYNINEVEIRGYLEMSIGLLRASTQEWIDALVDESLPLRMRVSRSCEEG